MRELEAVIFDLDGTLVDVPYDWILIRKKLGTQDVPILHYISNLEEPEKTKKLRLLEKFEEEASNKAVLKKGIPRLMGLLEERGIKKILVTNNSRKNVLNLLKRFKLEFDHVLTREDGLWKPSGAPFLAALKKFGIERQASCIVGDSLFDVKAAEEAGITKVFILSSEKEKFPSSVELVKSVDELQKKIENLFPGLER
ncbi:MAG: HAD-IA family hydrolase [Candidatus Aminicenantes bacterium]|nr:HAD-IA family hydrolase [Candidatus Aminicenantes bacterium]